MKIEVCFESIEKAIPKIIELSAVPRSGEVINFERDTVQYENGYSSDELFWEVLAVFYIPYKADFEVSLTVGRLER